MIIRSFKWTNCSTKKFKMWLIIQNRVNNFSGNPKYSTSFILGMSQSIFIKLFSSNKIGNKNYISNYSGGNIYIHIYIHVHICSYNLLIYGSIHLYDYKWLQDFLKRFFLYIMPGEDFLISGSNFPVDSLSCQFVTRML